MGTPELASASLQALLDCSGLEVVAVVTQPDRPKGRELRLTASPVKDMAQRQGLPILQPEKARDDKFVSKLAEFRPDLIAVAAFGQILPRSILELPRFGCLNVHTSLLPKYRGAAPIQWAILNGESETGVTIMKMDAGLDTGAIISQTRTEISHADDAQTLHDRLAALGAKLLVQTIPRYVAGEAPAVPQPVEGVSYARKIVKQDGLLDWKRRGQDLWNQVRGLVSWPGAYTHLPSGHSCLLKIWQAKIEAASAGPGEILTADKSGIVIGCGEQALRILMLQREGARRLTPQQFLAGFPLRAGQRLGP